MELGIPYRLVGADGTVAVVGNSDAAQADPDYVGWLDPEQGIAGLDSPELREVSQDIVQGDGGIHYDFFRGRRPLVVNGSIDPNLGPIETIIGLEQKLKRIMLGNPRADAILSFTNSGFPARQLSLRPQQGFRITGRLPKTFQLPLVSADWRLLGTTEKNVAAQAPRQFGPFTPVTNDGDAVATARFELTGPIVPIDPASPIRLRNYNADLEVRFKLGFEVAVGEVLIVDLAPPYPVVELDGEPVYGEIDYLPTTWWGLTPGVQDVGVEAAGAGTWRVFWHDAWV